VAPTVISKISAGTVPFKDVSLSQNSEFDPLHQQKARAHDHQHYECETEIKSDLGAGRKSLKISNDKYLEAYIDLIPA